MSQPVRPTSVRPHRGWYLFAAALVASGLLCCGYGAVFGTHALGKPWASAPMGDSVTITARSGQSIGFASTLESETPHYYQQLVRCSVINTDGDEAGIAGETSASGVFWMLTTNDGKYHLSHVDKLSESGRFTVTCDQYEGSGTRFAVVSSPSTLRMLFGLASVLMATPCTLLAGLVVALVVAVRRRGARRRISRTVAAA